MIDVNALVCKFRAALNEQWGYIWGGKGQTWTQAKQNAATRAQTVKYGAKWIGRRVADCSGLFAWAFKELGGSIYHGSNTIWRSYCAKKGALKNGVRTDGLPLKPGTALFLTKTENGTTNRHHIGLYVGDDTVIEAKGTAYGVVTSNTSHWDEWGELKDVGYEGNEGVVGMQTVRFGSVGETVKELQLLLNQRGATLEEDGRFGEKTAAAVLAFQRENGLETDGIVGQYTWDALVCNVNTDDEVADDENEELISRDEFDALVERVAALEKIVGDAT